MSLEFQKRKEITMGKNRQKKYQMPQIDGAKKTENLKIPHRYLNLGGTGAPHPNTSNVLKRKETIEQEMMLWCMF